MLFVVREEGRWEYSDLQVGLGTVSGSVWVASAFTSSINIEGKDRYDEMRVV